MLTGHLPFGGDAYGDVLMKHLTMQPPAARSLVPELPEELDAVLSRALAKRPEDRYIDAGAMLRDLEALLLACGADGLFVCAEHAAQLPVAEPGALERPHQIRLATTWRAA